MNLTKNQLVIVAVLIVGVIAYFMFFRKKKSSVAKVVVMPPPAATPATTKAESSWSPDYYDAEDLMDGIGTAGASGGVMESSYDDLAAAPTEASLAGIGFNTNWLGY